MKIVNIKKKVTLFTILLIMLSTIGCSKTPNTNSSNNKDNSKYNIPLSFKYKSEYSGKKPIVTIEMEDGAVIKAELYPDVAPRTVDNFVSLIQKDFYNGLIFHRVIPGFMIQGGAAGTGSAGTIPGEFESNGFNNSLKHTRGVISMARTQDPNSASSQFFIMVKDSPHLDKNYAAFGKVTEGMDEADKIVNTKRDRMDNPLEPQRMKKVTIEIK